MADVLKGLNLLETLKDSIEKNKLSDVRDAVEDLLISRLNIGVAGERGPEKVAFINSLRGLGVEDEGAAIFPSTGPPEELAMYPNPKNADFRLFDLPAVPTKPDFDPEEYMERFKVQRYNAVLMTFTKDLHPNSVAVWMETRSMQRDTIYFALLASEKDTDATLDARRKVSVELLKAQGVARPRVFVLRPAALEKLDFLKLLKEMEGDLPEVRAHALLMSLPAFSADIVTRKRDAFKALVWAAASLSGGVSAIPVPLVASMVDASVGLRILSKAQTSLGLDDDSLDRLARQRGVDAGKLKELRSCALSAEVTKAEVKRRLSVAEKNTSTNTTRLMEMAMPLKARSVSHSFTVMLQALNSAIDDMGADAEKIVAAVIGAEK
ncbi:LOW QUALITY PROTEIN: interferon-inducible GTPase 5-like [Denticeps clupeoides]|uniref:LOW QUALITY PROTEIN: interferon-inducible GTPase 5-like n=1 Tax=Denticeps clupeoides TaxID=299321 RepID=UPI0010A4CCD8|nr:LOW QUALITY PROTEIN: interferon-inducible GTPase 5-like [Denticeps clupeoides]